MNVCVFCSASQRLDPSYYEMAREIGRTLVKNQCGVVYGGTSVGMMGALADEVLKEKGKVIGILPSILNHIEPPHDYLTEFHRVDSLSIRKEMMAEKSDLYLALPGGFGTLNEVTEVVCWEQVQDPLCKNKPIICYNPDGFWNGFLDFLKNLDEKKLIPAHWQEMIVFEDDIKGLEKYFK